MTDSFYYDQAKETAESVLREITSSYEPSITNIQWHHFITLLKEEYGVAIEPHVFKNNTLNARFAGVCELGDHPLIQFNNSTFQNEERQHFTIVHEGVHYYRHKNDSDAEGETFSDIIQNASYPSEEQTEELITNQAASIIMLNDAALTKCMSNRWSFGKIAGFYGMSPSVLFRRFVNFLYFNLNINFEASHYLVGRFRYGDTTEARSFLPLLINYFDYFVDWFHDFPLTGDTLDELYMNLGVGFEAPTSHWYQLKHVFPNNKIQLATNM